MTDREIDNLLLLVETDAKRAYPDDLVKRLRDEIDQLRNLVIFGERRFNRMRAELERRESEEWQR